MKIKTCVFTSEIVWIMKKLSLFVRLFDWGGTKKIRTIGDVDQKVHSEVEKVIF